MSTTISTTMTATSTTSTPGSAEGLPHQSGDLVVADGGLETWLLFQEGIDLPDFAAFPLLDDEAGREALNRYFDHFAGIADDHGAGLVIDTATWRASPDWGPRLGYDEDGMVDVNARAVAFARDVAARHPGVRTWVNGAVGPRGDGYVVGDAMSADEAARYHALQIRALAQAGADIVTAVTMTDVDEAIGIVRAALDAGIPVAIGFTTETDGRLPSGVAIGDAIGRVDAATGGAVEYFMINCAHPDHFRDQLTDGAGWQSRVQAVRANASRLSHAELDEADELDRGDPAELADLYGELRELLPNLRIVGGCCGTDHDHVRHIAQRFSD